jgi:hypothetical protein
MTMRLRDASRTFRGLFTAAALMLPLLPSPLTAGDQGKLFTGGASSRTAEGAIRGAIEDAENSAAAEQLYTCALVGKPQVFPRPNDPNGRVFSAEATVSCTP